MKPKILVICHDVILEQLVRDVFGQTYDVFGAGSPDDGERLFHEHRDAFLIVMSGFSGKTIRSLPLIRKIIQVYNYPGYILANSGNPVFDHPAMMEAGCTHEVKGLEFLSAIREIDKLPYPKPAA